MDVASLCPLPIASLLPRSIARPLAPVVLAVSLFGCGRQDPTGAAATAATQAASAPAAGGSPAAAEQLADHLELLKLTLTSGVKDKEPVDRLTTAPAGQRVYAHLSVRNRTGEARRVEVTFQVEGKTRTQIHLVVEPSWRWRTWGFNTLREGDAGELMVIAREEHGPELGDAVVPIRVGGARRPAP